MKATTCKNRCLTVVKWFTIAVVVGFFAAVAVSYFVNKPSAVEIPPLQRDDPALVDDLVEGGPVVAPTTTNTGTCNPNQTNDSSFGNEKYIWDDWSNNQ